MRTASLLAAVCFALAALPRALPADEPRTLTLESLKARIEDLGYEAKDYGNSLGVSLADGNYTVVETLSFSGDMSNLWIVTTFAGVAIKKPDQAPAADLAKLLEANYEFGPAFFSVPKESGTLQLQFRIDNRDVTNPQLRKAVTRFAEVIRKSDPVWTLPSFKAPAEEKKGAWRNLPDSRDRIASVAARARFAAFQGTAKPDKIADVADLKDRLERIGYDSEEVKDANGKVASLNMTTQRDAISYTINASLYQETLFLQANVANIADADKAPAAAVYALLTSNFDTAPAHFELNPKTRNLLFTLYLDNRSLTNAVLRKQVSLFETNLHNTREIWKAENFAAKAGN